MGILSKIRNWWRPAAYPPYFGSLHTNDAVVQGPLLNQKSMTNAERMAHNQRLHRKSPVPTAASTGVFIDGVKVPNMPTTATPSPSEQRQREIHEWRRKERERAEVLRREREEDDARKRRQSDDDLSAAIAIGAVVMASQSFSSDPAPSTDSYSASSSDSYSGGGGDSGGGGASSDF